MPHELHQEEGTAARLLGDILQHARSFPRPRLRNLRCQQRRQSLTVLWRQRSNLQLAPLVASLRQRRQEHPENGARLHILRSVAHDQQQLRCIGRLQELDEKRCAVLIAPLQVIDPQHQRNASRQPSQQRPQRIESRMPYLLWIRSIEISAASVTSAIKGTRCSTGNRRVKATRSRGKSEASSSGGKPSKC